MHAFHGRRIHRTFLVFASVAGFTLAMAAETTVPPPGIRENTPAVFALTGVRLVAAPGQVAEKATLVVRDGVITAAGPNVAVPKDARVFDMTGKTVYAGLIDAYTEPPKEAPGQGGGMGMRGDGQGPGTPAPKGGANYWSADIVPQTRADRTYVPDDDLNKKLRGQGITARLLAPAKGIIKGTSVLVTTGEGDGTASIVKDRVALHGKITTSRGFGDGEGYPGSPMGAYSLFRQSFYDADWYRQAWDAYQKDKTLPRPERNDALEALQGYAGGAAPVVIDAGDELYDLRADRIGREFSLNVIIRGSGNEYRRLNEIAATGRPIIVPLNMPDVPKVKTPEEAMAVSLETMMHWDIAPENAGRLDKAGVRIAFTSEGLKDRGEFLGAVRKAVERGLNPDAALKALTVTPATLFGVADRFGTLDVGKAANFIVTDGDLFNKKTKILETWVLGDRFQTDMPPAADVRGTWELKFSESQGANDTVTLSLKGEPAKLSGSITRNRKESKFSSVGLNDTRLGFAFKGDSLTWPGVVRMSATLSGDALLGAGNWADGGAFSWTGKRTAPFAPEPDTAKVTPPEMASFPVNYPLGGFGVAAIPPQPDAVFFQNATVWTSGPQGKLDKASVLVQKGKIAAVGRDLAVPAGAVIVDATGKHLTPGVIDEHSHIATDGGVNESGQTISAEVRIGDFIDPNDITIYRQLAGGVTMAHVLHGSANTIGGQNQIIKLRWGVAPEELKLAGAPEDIKFALGENVKQSNWGDRYNTRYPQTRMGAEQIVRDEFKAGLDYKARWAQWRKDKKGIPPRRDLELDAIVEILDGTRLVHCHAYRQDEMLALMRTFEDFGIRLVTFEHVLEGYKIGLEMAKHGVGGSTFSDWWAYKMEVCDAIPYNGALMHSSGVLVSFNSDSGEMARRLNWEADKAVKYGAVPEEDALKFVTINPAKQLHVDSRVGSIEVGKDADLALWSGPPLSSLSHCEQTWIDGRKYFDRQDDVTRRAENEKMRAALIQKVLKSGDAGDMGGGDKKPKWPREDVFDETFRLSVEGR